MRRKDKEKELSFAMQVLDEAEYGVLAMVEKGDSPYAIPLSFVRFEQKLYIHGATEGKKLNIIKENPKVCFTCVSYTKLIGEKFTTDYKSVVLFGKAAVVTDEKERHFALMAIAKKYSPQYLSEAEDYIERFNTKTTLIVINIKEVTAKGQITK